MSVNQRRPRSGPYGRRPFLTLKGWPKRMGDWMDDNGILDPSKRAKDPQRK
jgi:hypothetical protein